MLNRNAYRFFHDRAGYVVGERALCAASLARAEAQAEALGLTFSWEWDDSGDLGDHEYWCSTAAAIARGRTIEHQRNHGCNHEVTLCVVRDPNGSVLASLGSIIDADPIYRRVVEAELACEALAFYVPSLVGCP